MSSVQLEKKINQNQSKEEKISIKSNEQQEKILKIEEKSELLAKLFKYLKQEINPFLRFRLSLERIKYKTDYEKDKKYYIKLAEICEKYKINSNNYISFCVRDLNIRNARELLNIVNIRKYSDKLLIEKKYENIYNNFIKSANNIANECIISNKTPKEYLRDLILENKLAYEYFCGGISKYYIASIQNFKKIYFALDKLNRDELSIIYDATEELNQNLQDAFMKFKNTYVTPISFTEEIIKQKLNNN